MKKWGFALVLALLVAVLPGAACADEAYDIISYDVHMVISENNVADVTETITVNFTQERHGIYYYRQYQGDKYYYIDDEWVDVAYNNRISQFRVQDQKFSVSRTSYDGNRYLEAKIGDSNKTVIGEQTYVITYRWDLGNNGFDTFDDFYRDIIVCDVGDTIQNASFTIELPDDFDTSLVTVMAGGYGSMDTSRVRWQKDGTTLTGQVSGPLYGLEYVTVYMEFDEDFFTGESNPEATWNTVVRIIALLCTITAFVLWILFGRDKKIYPTVEFYPPDGLSPAEVGYINDGYADNKDIVALLMYWADQGCIRIEEQDRGDFAIIWRAPLPDTAPPYERTMFGELFASGSLVLLSSLKRTFYTSVNAAKKGVTDSFAKSDARRVFTRQSKKARGIMAVLTMLPIAFAVFAYAFNVTGEFLNAVFIAFMIGWLIGLPVLMLAHCLEKWHSTQPAKRMITLVLSIVVLTVVLLLYAILVPVFSNAADPLAMVLTTLLTCVSTVIMIVLAVIMRKRTEQGDSWLGRIRGFKRFIEAAEKDRILRLVEQNPGYFYNILPYAYVLGVTNKWAKNFEEIAVQPPDWYSGRRAFHSFNAMVFASQLSHSMAGFQSAMTSRPSSGSGSGGGFSGGGGGGGGVGGSW